MSELTVSELVEALVWWSRFHGRLREAYDMLDRLEDEAKRFILPAEFAGDYAAEEIGVALTELRYALNEATVKSKALKKLLGKLFGKAVKKEER